MIQAISLRENELDGNQRCATTRQFKTNSAKVAFGSSSFGSAGSFPINPTC